MSENGIFVNWKIIAETVRIDLKERIEADELDAVEAVWCFVKAFNDTNSGGPMTDEICWAMDLIFGKSGVHTSGSHVNYLIVKLEEDKKMIVGRRKSGYRVPGRIRAV